jgi:thioredoxin reductase (NADPH)
MAKPVILTVDDDAAVSSAISRDLTDRYGGDYRVIGVTSGAAALDVLARIALRAEAVALVVSDQRMPAMTGIELFAASRTHAAEAKLLLLTAYADTEVAIEAINDIGLDYYLLKPWDPPEDRLYPVVDELLDDWRAEHPEQTSELRVVGNRWSERAHELKMFLTRNHVPYRWYDVERDVEGERLRALADAGPDDLPLVLVPSGRSLRSPTVVDLADALGLHTTARQPIYDVCIVGGGPAGLAAAVYAASEGLSTVVVEREAPGGQAGQSAAIENYLGFPRGLSGSDLAQRALAQVSRFGAEMVLARSVTGLQVRGPVRAVLLGHEGEIEARSVIVASGVSYRRLDAPGTTDLVGRGVFYGATAAEAVQTAGDDVFLVGAANSAGQAALNFARHAKHVTMLVRGPSLEATMSRYLIARIEGCDNIDVRFRTEVAGATGDGHLESVTLRDRSSGDTEDVPATWLYVFIGAAPRTDWLGSAVRRDEHGFVITGPELTAAAHGWTEPRPPYGLETSIPGVFAAGDVRLDSMKRVASAVGEGAMAIHLVHRYLATI